MNIASIAPNERAGDGQGFVGAKAALDEGHDTAVQAISLGLAEVGRRVGKVAFKAAFDAIAAGADLGGPHLALEATARPCRCLHALGVERALLPPLPSRSVRQCPARAH